MMLPEQISFPKAPLANFSSAVNQFGISAEDMCKGISYATKTNDVDVDLIGFSYSGKSDVIVNPYYDVTTVCFPRPESIQELHNCNNCGGTVDEKGYCRFCGSRVYFFGS